MDLQGSALFSAEERTAKALPLTAAAQFLPSTRTSVKPGGDGDNGRYPDAPIPKEALTSRSTVAPTGMRKLTGSGLWNRFLDFFEKSMNMMKQEAKAHVGAA